METSCRDLDKARVGSPELARIQTRVGVPMAIRPISSAVRSKLARYSAGWIDVDAFFIGFLSVDGCHFLEVGLAPSRGPGCEMLVERALRRAIRT